MPLMKQNDVEAHRKNTIENIVLYPKGLKKILLM